MPTANINILAVLVAAVLPSLGAVWYSPSCSPSSGWRQGYTPEKLDEMKRKGVTRPTPSRAVLSGDRLLWPARLVHEFHHLAQAVGSVPLMARFAATSGSPRTCSRRSDPLGARRAISSRISFSWRLLPCGLSGAHHLRPHPLVPLVAARRAGRQSRAAPAARDPRTRA